MSERVAIPRSMRAVPAVMVVLSVVAVFSAERAPWEAFGLALIALLFSTIGVLIAGRQPGNRSAWLLLAAGAGFLTQAFVNHRFGAPPQSPNAADFLALYLEGPTSSTIGILVPLGLLLYWFPEGRFLSRRWRWAGWLAVALVMSDLLGAVLVLEVGPINESWVVDNPLGVLTSARPFQEVSGTASLGLLAGGFVSIVTRYVRSNQIVRAQIKWVAFSVGFTAVVYAALLLGQWWNEPIAIAVSVVGFVSIPISIAIAILRFRLFAIDRLVSRSVGYAMVIGLLAAVYLALTSLPSLMIGGRSGTVDAPRVPPAIVAASTLTAVMLFDPLRRRVLSWVDRKFHRSHYDAERVVARFVSTINDEVDTARLASDSIAVVSDTMQPESVGIWIRKV